MNNIDFFENMIYNISITNIKDDNPLYKLPDEKDYIFIITKDALDYGIIEKNDKKIVKIPAFAFLYLLGRQE